MSKRKQSEGCRPMLRRTFLFLTGIALARVAADYLAIAQNRDNFLTSEFQRWYPPRDRAVESIQNLKSEEPDPRSVGSIENIKYKI
ncbi:MAG: hypothetical protein WBA89_18220 [Microcoleus sp.]|uniref:hypothetical protein n=1 Tax=Microcoleus sp. TaxID=44472 RepID=UPI003C76A74B